jgi:hypothetical protein
MAREGALEGGSSVSGDLTCWTAFLCFGLDSFVIFSCLGLAWSWKLGLVSCRRIDTGNLDEVRAAVGPSTKIVWIESPTNPRQMISDIREIAKIAHEYGALLVVDNSIMSPVLSKPLDLGAGKVYI